MGTSPEHAREWVKDSQSDARGFTFSLRNCSICSRFQLSILQQTKREKEKREIKNKLKPFFIQEKKK